MKILVAGDFCPRNRVAEAFDKGDFSSVLSEARLLTSNADYSIVNFECPVVSGNVEPIIKVGPTLKCSRAGVDALQYAGFNCVTLANNHFFDFGHDGVTETISVLDSCGIDHVGGGDNIIEASTILYKEIAGKRLAIINCCEHEFSIASENEAGCNPLNPINQYYDIIESKKKADFVIVIVHGGHELFQLPSLRMVETYHFFIDAGADAVVNHHQHCFSGYEVYNGKPIFYGLGNFCFDNPTFRSGIWTEGYAVCLNLLPSGIDYSLYPYCQCGINPIISLLSEDAYASRLDELNKTILDITALKNEIGHYYSECAMSFSNVFEPITNRYFLSAKNRGLIPSLIGKKRKLFARDYIMCEAHLDKLKWWLEN